MLFKQLVPYYARDDDAFENGCSSNAIAMDERFIETESYNKM
jgi:hypothetical protein